MEDTYCFLRDSACETSFSTTENPSYYKNTITLGYNNRSIQTDLAYENLGVRH